MRWSQISGRPVSGRPVSGRGQLGTGRAHLNLALRAAQHYGARTKPVKAWSSLGAEFRGASSEAWDDLMWSSLGVEARVGGRRKNMLKSRELTWCPGGGGHRWWYQRW